MPAIPISQRFEAIHSYLAVSRSLIALPNTVPFVIGIMAAEGFAWYWIPAGIIWAVLFYSYSCKVNDLADYRGDLANEGRTRNPIKNGAVTIERVGYWAAVELILLTSTVVAAPVVEWTKYGFVALVLLTTYGNAFQKTSRRVPPWGMDFLFGVTMAAPIVLCAYALKGTVEAPVALLSLSFLAQMVVLNSYSGNLKDLENDRRFGWRTTALVLGARRVATGRWHYPARYQAFLLAFQGISTLSVLAAATTSRDRIGLTLWETATLTAAVAISFAAAFMLYRRLRNDVEGRVPAMPDGTNEQVTRYFSRPPHLVLNALAFLMAAGALVGIPWLVLAVTASLALPKALVVSVRELTDRRMKHDVQHMA